MANHQVKGSGQESTIVFSNGVSLRAVEGERPEVSWGTNEVDLDYLDWLHWGWSAVLTHLHQGQLPLHASSAIASGRTCLIAGSAGAGKSTTMVALGERGHSILTDEVGIISFDGPRNGTIVPRLRPFSRPISLRREALALLNRPNYVWRPKLGDPEEGLIDGPSDLPDSLDLSKIFVLSTSEHIQVVERERLGPLEAFRSIIFHANYRGYSRKILGHERLMELVSLVVTAIPVVRISRPVGVNSLEEVLQAIEESILEDV